MGNIIFISLSFMSLKNNCNSIKNHQVEIILLTREQINKEYTMFFISNNLFVISCVNFFKWRKKINEYRISLLHYKVSGSGSRFR